MPKEIISKKPVSLAEVVAIFKKREEESELNYLQRIAQEHAQRTGKIPVKKARSLIKELLEDFELSESTVISIVNFMPKTIDELRIFLQDEPKVFSTEEVQKMLDLLKS